MIHQRLLGLAPATPSNGGPPGRDCPVRHSPLVYSDVAARPLSQGGTIVRCEPMTVVGQVGDTLTVDLYVENASDLYGVDLQLTFDTTIADVVDEDAGLIGVQILPLSGFLEPGFVVRKVADNSAGTTQYANTQLNPTLPPNGSGSVARVRMVGHTYGTINMTFTAHDLAARE